MRQFAIAVGLLLGTALTALGQLASPRVGCFPLQVQFSAPDNGEVVWDFGDGASSDLRNPSHVYTGAGTFSVVARRPGGGEVVAQTTVTVFAQPELTLAVDEARGCRPLAVDLAAGAELPDGITAEGYAWAFGDGNAGAGRETAHTYQQAGVFDVSVRLTTNLATCNVTETFPSAVTVLAGPTAAFATDPSPAQSCETPLTVRVIDQSTGLGSLTYSWDFGDGRSSAAPSPGPNVYSAAGAYRISLTVTDQDGCSDTATAPVSVGGPNADFSLPDTVCLGQTYLVAPRGAADAYAYTFGAGIVVEQDLGEKQLVTFVEAGPTTVSLAVENVAGGCSGDTTRQIFVQEVIIDATADPDYSCRAPFETRLRVNSPAGSASWFVETDTAAYTFTSRDTTVLIPYDEGGEYGYNWYEFVEAKVEVETPQGCFGDTTVLIATDLPNALFIPNVHNGCAPLTVTFADSVRSTATVTEYAIDWGDGQTEVFAAPGPWQHTYTEPGEYVARIAITNEDGCTDESWGVEIEVGAPVGGLSFDATAPTACFGDTLTFENTTADARVDNVKFRVEGGNDFHCGSEDSLLHVLTRAIDGDEIDVTLYVEYNGCVDSLSQNLPYTPAAFADLGYAVTCDTAFDVTLYNRSENSASDSLFLIGVTDTAFRQDLLFTGLDSIELTLPARGAYLAVLQSSNGGDCAPHTDTVDVYITRPVPRFEIPELLCSGADLVLDATESQDANPTCNIGYQWDFSWDRPYVTSDPLLNEMEVQANGRGDQFVELILEDVNGCRDTLRRETRLFATNAAITASASRICLPATVDFEVNIDADTTVQTVEWDFGGYGTSEEQAPTFTFPRDAGAPDTIIVTVTVTDELGCPGTATFPLVRYSPVSEISTLPAPPFVCAGESVTFAASDFTEEGSSLSYAWDFGNGTTSTEQTAVVTYDNPGTFPARLNFTEVATGCTGFTQTQVIVEDVPVPAFTSDIDDEALVCYPAIVEFTDESFSRFETSAIWEVGTVTGVGETFTATLGRGETVVTLTSVTNLAGCSASTERTFTTVGPAGEFTFGPSVICAGTEVTFQLTDTTDVGTFTWDFGNGETQVGTNPATVTYDFVPPGDSTVVSLTLESQSNECTFTQTETLRFTRVVADFVAATGSDVSCEPTVQLFDQSVNATDLLFTFPDGSTSASPTPTFDFGGAGEFEVRLQASASGGSCADDTTKTITVLPELSPSIVAVPACPGEAATFTVEAGRAIVDYDVQPANIIASANGDVFTTVPLEAGVSITVSVFDANGCEGLIEAFPLELSPTYSGRADTFVIFAGQEVPLTVENADGFQLQWDDPAAVGCNDCPMPTVSPNATRDYGLTVTDPGGCAPRRLVFRVVVAEEPVIPNLFSPNADGTNDTWRPLFPEGLTPTVEAYQVFSRWGSLVFESNDPAEAWTGDNNGSGDAPSDVYTYVVKLSFPGGSEFSDSGEVTLLR